MLSDKQFQPVEDQRPKRAFARLKTITLPKPRCPGCGSAKLKKYRSISDRGDGSSLAWVRCLAQGCGRKFRVLLE